MTGGQGKLGSNNSFSVFNRIAYNIFPVSVSAKNRPSNVAVIGLRVHSGWGALVTVAGTTEAVQVQVVDRRRIEIVDPKVPGAAQPYHFAEDLELRAAESHLEKCATMAVALASAGLSQAVKHARDLGWRLSGVAILLSASRPLPPLPKILASHAMIHAAEGEFFRDAFRRACRKLDIPVTGIRERDLDQHVQAAFGRVASEQKKKIAGMGRVLGPPWTQDQKTAALAATILLADARGSLRAGA